MLLHIVAEAEWARVSRSGEAYFAAGQDVVGFMHLSTPEQVLIPANLFYKGQENLVLVAIDEDALGPELKWEQGVPPSGDMLFPHLYGPLEPTAVIGAVPFPCASDGSFSLPDLSDVSDPRGPELDPDRDPDHDHG
ncbi:MAG: DUF952 domain-containing protein [Microthrixaceae bacterium]